VTKSLSWFSIRVEVPISAVFVHIKYNMASPTIPERIVLPRADALVHQPFDQELAEPLVEVAPATTAVALGRDGFVIVKAVELVVLCAPVGVADAP